MQELTYKNTNGDTVFTSLYLKNRRSCCKSGCLHCPYGWTLKQHGLQFRQLTEDDIALAQEIINNEQKEKEEGVSAFLLASAFGVPKKKEPLSIQNIKQYQFVILKGEICGLVKNGNLQAVEVFFLKHFQNQGLSIDIINSIN